MAERKNKPEIRFAGFDEPWEQRTLGEIGDFKNGMNFEKRAMGHGYPFVNLQDVFGRNTIDNTNLGLAESSNDQRQAYSLKRGDVLFIRSSVKPEGVGEAAVILEDMIDTTYSGFIIRYRTNNEMNDSFKCFVYSTKSIRKQILSSSTSSANTNINQDSLQNIVMNFPRFPEQSKIGSLFQTLDTLITLRQRKYDKLLTIKKALLEKMFPRDGATLPELRFAGFDDPWEQRTLGDEATEIVAGGDVDRDLLVKEGIYPVLANALTNDGIVGYYESKYRIKAPAVTVTGRGDVGHAKARNDNFTPIVRLLAIKSKHDINFLENGINTLQIAVESTGVPQLTVPQISKYELFFPLSINEEIAIGSLFQTLDTLITLQKQELDKLRQLKKALLEKMFV